MTKEEFLESCMATEDPMHYYVSESNWRGHVRLMKQLKTEGYKFSLSMVDSLDNI